MAGDPATDVDVSRVESEDSRVYVRVSTIGKSGTRPFVLVPGIGVASNYFERLAPNLNEFGPVHALDLPGFAGVPHPDQAMSIREYADLVGRAIDELGLDDPVVVGHSMGTQVVVDLVARRPELTTCVLIGPVINPAERSVGLQGIRFLQAAMHEPGRVKLLAMSAYLFCGPKWFSRILPKMMRFPIERALPHVKADTLVIRGEFDAVAPRDWVRRCGELLPSSRLWEIPGAAHSVMHAHAEEVAKLCVEHARQPLEYDEEGTLREFVHDDGGDRHASTPASLFGSIRGRLVEALGMMREDDRLIEQGKTEHAEASQEAHGGD
ncbi:alpha/beta fold hydrolase [Frondihabitans australicus]|uniref:Pimeloyl-ACP methyl ester carboxylesterase n=1 Tax=Frondihabitans australicus TaxID=386892 RepID=A0A495ICG7_9MICO|nr:alpha/beta hydrolase [Frondihabitans australicus]RKR72991.1 pimeloyl-ACP methyl ester carboxylesterase [Frondihabitans australicus]